MNAKQSLSGEYLKKLYTENRLSDELQTHENIKTLLNYELDNMGDTIDSNFNFEIIDFCIEKLKETEPIDEQKLDFLGEKIMFKSQKIQQKEKKRRFRKMTAIVATVGIIVGAMAFSGEEGLAGNFDFIHRLIWKDEGEQLSLKTPDLTLKKVELKVGHLPDKMPRQFHFIDSNEISSNELSKYSYIFADKSDNKLIIYITDYKNNKNTFDHEIEMNKRSSTIKSINDVECYYNSNHNINSISWPMNQQIYMVSGNFDFKILEQIVSLYFQEKEN